MVLLYSEGTGLPQMVMHERTGLPLMVMQEGTELSLMVMLYRDGTELPLGLVDDLLLGGRIFQRPHPAEPTMRTRARARSRVREHWHKSTSTRTL